MKTLRRSSYTTLVAAIALLAALLSTDNLNAGPITADNVPTITVDVEGFAGPPFEFSPALDALEDVAENRPGRKLGVARAFENIQGNRANVVIEELEFDPDPFVVNNLLVTNTTDATQIFTVGIALPTAFPGPNIISGTIDTSVIDAGGAAGGTVATVVGFPIYTAEIDFASVATLQDHPFSVVAPAAGTDSAMAAFGPSVNPTPVTASIGIQLRFSLSARDTASILSRFDVVAIPEPTSLSLGGMALLAVVTIGARRRR